MDIEGSKGEIFSRFPFDRVRSSVVIFKHTHAHMGERTRG